MFGNPLFSQQQSSSGTSGGLFGGGTTTSQGGLFGGNMGGAGQSLFGGQANPVGGFGNKNIQGGGLFGGSQPAQSVGGGLFGGQSQTQQQPTIQGGGLFGGQGTSGGGGLFGAPATTNQPSPFSLNAPSQPSGGLFGGGAQPSSGGLFGGGQSFGPTQGIGLGGNSTSGQTTQFGGFGGSTQPQQGGGLFGAMPSTVGQGQSSGGLFGAPSSSVGGGLFGGSQQQTQQPQSGGLFGMPSQTSTTGGGLFGMNPSNPTGGMLGGGTLGGGFNMGNNNGGMLGGLTTNTQGTTGFGFNNQTVGSFGQNSNNVTQPFVAKKSFNDSLSNKPSERNLVYAISNGSDKCIVEIALVQRKMVKAGQLQPNPQGGIPQAQQQQGGLFGGGNQNNTQTGALGGGGLFGATPTQQSGGLFGAQPSAGGLFGQQKQTQPGQFGGLFGQAPSTTSGGLLGNTTNGGGLFGQQASAPQSGGLFGGTGFGQSTAPSTGGGLFGNQQPQQTQAGGFFGGQSSQPTQGGLFGTLPSLPSGGLFGGPAPAPTINTGFSLGGTNTTTGGGLFGNQPQTNQPTSGGLFGGQSQSNGGLFGASNQQSNGLFGQQTSSGGFFGQTTTTTYSSQTNLSGGLFGGAQTQQYGNAGPQTYDQVGRYQSLLNFLENTSQQQEDKRLILDEDLEAKWVYGKTRDSDSLNYFQNRENEKQGEVAITASEYQVLYGYQSKKKELDQFLKLSQKNEQDRKEDIRKTISAFTGGKQSTLIKPIDFNLAGTKSERLSTSSQASNNNNNSERQLLQQMENCLDFIKQGFKSRIKIPIKPRYTYGDVKNYILDSIIDNDLTLEGAKQFRLLARLKEPNQTPKSLKENEKVLSSTIYSSIDYIELIEKTGYFDQSLNNSMVYGQNILEVSHLSGRNNLELDDKITQTAASVTDVAAPVQKRFNIPSEFKISPSRETLEKLGDGALQKVENFSIENNFVKIAFEDPINLLNADLTGLFFGENKISIEGVPSADRINKPCIIQFLKFGQKQLDDRKTPLEVQKLVEKLVRKMNLDLIKPYDVKNTCLIYRQENFN